ncbi:MAG: universal stress protein [Dinghuibacter sp.]|nr:universal stress protein [Dinghuibacter sp.]
MKTFFVPTDFSDTAKNAARYALQFAGNFPGSRIVLFHTYDKHGYGSDGTPLQVDEETERNIALAALTNHRAELLADGAQVPVDIMTHAGGLSEGLEEAVKDTGVDLVIMGINESNALDQFLVGSTTLRLIKKHISPVLIVPEGVSYSEINKLVFASDLEDTDNCTPVSLIRHLCGVFNTNINVVHVGGYYNPDERTIQASKLDECKPEYHFLEGSNIAHPINQFVAETGAGLLIMVSRKHDFFERLFRKSNTQVMAYNSKVPIIAIHESLCAMPVVKAGE